MHNNVIFFHYFLYAVQARWAHSERTVFFTWSRRTVAHHIMLWILYLKFYSDFWFPPLSTELAVMFPFKIGVAMKSLDKKPIAILTIKLHMVDFLMRSASWKAMGRILITMNVVCKTRTSARRNIHKSPPILMAETVILTVWVPEIFIKSNKTVWASECMLSKPHHYRAEGFFYYQTVVPPVAVA